MRDEDCPRMIALSALVDDEIAAEARLTLLAHARHCPLCGAALAELRALRAAFATLPQESPDFDLGHVIEATLRAQASASPASRPRLRDRLFPSALRGLQMPAVGAATALALGLQLGTLLLEQPARGAREPRLVAMAVFDPIAPGGLCPPANCIGVETSR